MAVIEAKTDVTGDLRLNDFRLLLLQGAESILVQQEQHTKSSKKKPYIPRYSWENLEVL